MCGSQTEPGVEMLVAFTGHFLSENRGHFYPDPKVEPQCPTADPIPLNQVAIQPGLAYLQIEKFIRSERRIFEFNIFSLVFFWLVI